MLSLVLRSILNSQIKNSKHFLEKISVPWEANHNLISFNVLILFTNISVKRLLEYLTQSLQNIRLPIHINNVITLLVICILQHVFLLIIITVGNS